MTGPSETFAPTACARNRFTPLRRFVILFGMGFAVQYGLRLTSIDAPVQALVVAGVTTALVWALWSAGAANRRLMLGITAMLWVATLAKIVRM